MNFRRLPDNVFVKIFEYLPLEERIRSGRVSKTFRRISQLTTSHTKSLNLTKGQFKNLTDDQLAVILKLCSTKLEQIKFPSRGDIENTSKTSKEWYEWEERSAGLDVYGGELATKFSYYQCNRMIDIDLGYAAIDPIAFSRLIRNNPKMECLIWRRIYGRGFPSVTNENLKKLTLHCSDDVMVQSIIGHCPNLEEFELAIAEQVSANVLDRVFASVPKVHRVDLKMDSMYSVQKMKIEKTLVNLWNLRLTSFNMQFWGTLENDDILKKVATSFPNLQSFRIGSLEATNNGIAALGALEELEILELPLHGNRQNNDFQQGLRQLIRCKKLRKLVMEPLSIRSAVFISLLRGCPQLDQIDICEIDEVGNADKAVELLESLSEMGKRDITIQFHTNEVDSFKSIWEAESVKEMVKSLEENDGSKIKIDRKQIKDDSFDYPDSDTDSSDWYEEEYEESTDDE